MADHVPGVPEFTNSEAFIKAKLKMLREDLFIEPTLDELAKLNAGTTEHGINRVVSDIISAHYERDDFIPAAAPKKCGRPRKERKT